jgi:hypothetical protein
VTQQGQHCLQTKRKRTFSRASIADTKPHLAKTCTIYCDNDVYICAVYAPPSDSSYYEESVFHTEIITFQAEGKVFLCGNFNARTGSEP